MPSYTERGTARSSAGRMGRASFVGEMTLIAPLAFFQTETLAACECNRVAGGFWVGGAYDSLFHPLRLRSRPGRCSAGWVGCTSASSCTWTVQTGRCTSLWKKTKKTREVCFSSTIAMRNNVLNSKNELLLLMDLQDLNKTSWKKGGNKITITAK